LLFYERVGARIPVTDGMELSFDDHISMIEKCDPTVGKERSLRFQRFSKQEAFCDASFVDFITQITDPRITVTFLLNVYSRSGTSAHITPVENRVREMLLNNVTAVPICLQYFNSHFESLQQNFIH
jgi:hypothetical protein